MGADRAARVLVADDQADVRRALRMLLKAEGWEVAEAASPTEIAALVGEREFDVVLMDLNYARDTTSGREGLDLLPRLGALDPDLPVLVMTAWGSIEGAVEAVRRGARDYIEKPWDNDRLLATLRTQVDLVRALRRSQKLRDEQRRDRERNLPPFLAESAAMQPVLELMERVAPSDANVLITGEHGTGKEVVARWLHAASGRAEHSLVPLNAGGLGEGVFESECFGHVKGAFTDAVSDRVGCFELADRGTLFLDEIANMPRAQQAKLLRVLQAGEFQRLGSSQVRRVDVRIVSATNADVFAEAREGRFREDLLYRLNTVEIALPPLRERGEDVPLLADHFLEGHARHYGKSLAGFSQAAREQMRAHGWPGNVRELDHAVERAVLMARGDTIEAGDLALRAEPASGPGLEELTLEEAEDRLVRRALERCGGNVSRAAQQLGLSRSALYRRLGRSERPRRDGS